MKQGLLRPKLSQRPGGVFKRNNLPEKSKNMKVSCRTRCRVARVVDNIGHWSIIVFLLKKSIICQKVDNLVDILSTIAERRKKD